MAGYLEEYGTRDVRREKVTKWLVISVIVLTIAVIAGYFIFRTYPAKRKTEAFLEDLNRHDYRAAYRLWGCEQPCRDYSFEKFMEDWGPQSDFKNPSSAEIRKTRFCKTGVIVTLGYPGAKEIPLWYERSNGTLGFSPWPVCAEHIPAPE